MKHISLLIVLLAFTCSDLNSQDLLDRLGKKMEQKIKDRAERKVDQAMDKTLDKTEEKIDKSVKGNKNKNSKNEESSTEEMTEEEMTKWMQENEGNATSFLESVETQSSYKYDIELVYHVTTTSEKEIIEIEYLYGVPKINDDFMTMQTLGLWKNGKKENMPDQQKSTIMIMDSKNKAMVTVMAAQKQYMAMNMTAMSEMTATIIKEDEEQQDEMVNPPTVTKTGRTKTILGYSSEEYAVKSEDTVGTIWISTDSRLVDFNPFKAMASMAVAVDVEVQDVPYNGTLLEMNMEFTDVKKKKDTSSMSYVVKEINLVNKTIDLTGYKNLMDMK